MTDLTSKRFRNPVEQQPTEREIKLRKERCPMFCSKLLEYLHSCEVSDTAGGYTNLWRSRSAKPET